jgi:hypothetical protein
MKLSNGLAGWVGEYSYNVDLTWLVWHSACSEVNTKLGVENLDFVSRGQCVAGGQRRSEIPLIVSLSFRGLPRRLR